MGIYAKNEFKLYVAGIVFALVSFFGIMIFSFSPLKLSDIIPRCSFHYITGLYCPGCGGTRAVISFVSGKWIKSFLYNPFVPYCGILYIMYMTKGTFAVVTKGRYDFMKFRYGYLYVGIVVLLAQFIIKNILLIFWDIDILAIRF